MKVLVTGGSGYVGCHTIRSAVEAGHEVRALVRSRERLDAALAPLGAPPVEPVVGDVLDAGAVRRALEGCDAAIHAANVFSLDVRDARLMRETNRASTELVLGAAADLGLDPVVHVSSVAVLDPSSGTFHPDAPLITTTEPYARTKVDAERVARAMQERGAPVVITYPAMVWGPHDPHMGESAMLARDILKGRTPAMPPGGLTIVDVRDVAAVHAAVLTPGQGPRRYVAASEYLPIGEVVEVMRERTGRRLPMVRIPAAAGLAAGRAADAVRAWLPWRLPIGHEAVRTLQAHRPPDASRTRSELGVEFRPAAGSIGDTLAWLAATRRVRAREAGRLAGAEMPQAGEGRAAATAGERAGSQ